MTSLGPRIITGLSASLLMFAALAFSGPTSSATVQCDSRFYYGYVGQDTCNIFTYECGNAEKQAKAKSDCERYNGGACRPWRGSAFPAC